MCIYINKIYWGKNHLKIKQKINEIENVDSKLNETEIQEENKLIFPLTKFTTLSKLIQDLVKCAERV